MQPYFFETCRSHRTKVVMKLAMEPIVLKLHKRYVESRLSKGYGEQCRFLSAHLRWSGGVLSFPAGFGRRISYYLAAGSKDHALYSSFWCRNTVLMGKINPLFKVWGICPILPAPLLVSFLSQGRYKALLSRDVEVIKVTYTCRPVSDRKCYKVYIKYKPIQESLANNKLRARQQCVYRGP